MPKDEVSGKVIESLEIKLMQLDFELNVLRGARANYTRLYMAKKEELIIYQRFYKRIIEYQGGIQNADGERKTED